MKNVLLQAAIKLNKTRKKRKWWQTTVRVMAAVVVFCTTYALILPAITMEVNPICGLEEHIHGESCYAEQAVTAIVCGQSNVAHSHDSFCYDTQGNLICPLPQMDAHTHADTCYGPVQILVCQSTPETDPEHTHAEGCYAEETALTCQLPELAPYSHTASCHGKVTRTVLTCGLAEHSHEESCFPAEEDPAGVGAVAPSSEYLCGIGPHEHLEGCYDGAGTLTCSIPEHVHIAACILPNLDLTADMESQTYWDQMMGQLPFTGNWSHDLLLAARSQIGYAESTRNMILEDNTLKGYTRYGDWYGIPYGDWCAMFLSFCLHYAGVEDIPQDCSVNAWINSLEALQMYNTSDTYVPQPGDLIFFDHDQTGEEGIYVNADHVGLVEEVISAADGTAQVRTIEGNSDDRVQEVTYKLSDPTIVGYGILPTNPLTLEEWAQVKEVNSLLSQLPEAEALQTSFEELNQLGDKLGFEALRQEVIGRISPIVEQYNIFTDLQKERVHGMDNLQALQQVCGGATWEELPVLTDDSASVTGMTALEPEVIRGAAQEEISQLAASNRHNSVYTGDSIRFPFTVEMESYYTDIHYSEARVKVEMILPLPQSQATFDTAAMTWLEEPVLTTVNHELNGSIFSCQVLSGYKKLTSNEHIGRVVSGSFTEDITINVTGTAHGNTVGVIVSAAMEHSTWDGTCPTHGIKEKLSVATETFVLYHPLTAEEQQIVFESYTTLVADASEDELNGLEQKIYNSYCSGALSDDQYSELYQNLLNKRGIDLDSIAEPSVGNGWIWMDFTTSGFITESEVLTTSVSATGFQAQSAMPQEAYRNLNLDSNSQIPENGWGGENSADDVIWVSKTIEGTEQENVFDITLQIITKDVVDEIYKEPNMAVVIVMDISNTMTSVFSGETTVTRYDAAMASAEQFLRNFAEETDGVSRVGYVAFNTHGHEVFPMQECSTTAQATALANTMRTKTKSIMDTAAKAAGGKYADSHDRFTNIEAGLKTAADMLNNVSNEHKYIIFLSDGFPTTYMTASASDGYKGYDPYTGSGSNGTDGVFYDRIMGVHRDYGTSYSDTAAIKARQMAVSLKNQGINIFSIGVDVAGQTIKYYHDSSVNNMITFSVVERRQTASYYNSTGYEIGTLHSEITKANPTNAEKAAMAQDFKDWLKGSASSGIGSGYYFDSTDQDGLEEAYSQIFATIQEMNAQSAHLDWVATDPMPDMGVHELETMEFIGFWDYNGVLTDGPLVGASQDNSLYFNTATFDTATSTIHWDLKDSGYQSVSYGNNKNYQCALKYRVRLQNENNGFIERNIYDTNDTTYLNYRIIEVVNDVTSISERKYIEFPIPKVFGYLSELSFKKVDDSGNPLPGAEFALTHDTENCGTCRGDGKGHVTLPVYEATSDESGMVTFTNIPSGHHYKLTETAPPFGYAPTKNTYSVVVSYDALTVTVTDADGNPLEWTESIMNFGYYELPVTGGPGTSFYTFSGLLVLMAAACGYVIYYGRKRRKGGAKG